MQYKPPNRPEERYQRRIELRVIDHDTARELRIDFKATKDEFDDLRKVRYELQRKLDFLLKTIFGKKYEDLLLSVPDSFSSLFVSQEGLQRASDLIGKPDKRCDD